MPHPARRRRPGAIAAYGVLRALCTVVESVASLPELMPALEEVLFPLLHRYTSTEGQDIFEEVMQILTYLTYYSPALSPRLWTLFPAVLAAVDEWAIDFFENAMLPLDNFISRGTDVFLASTAPNYLALTNQTLERVLCGPGSEDYPEDQAIAAPKLMGTILQHCRGRVDACVGACARRGAPGTLPSALACQRNACLGRRGGCFWGFQGCCRPAAHLALLLLPSFHPAARRPVRDPRAAAAGGERGGAGVWGRPAAGGRRRALL